MNHQLLLNTEVTIVEARNKSLIGLKGIVTYESDNRKYLILYDPKTRKYKGVSDCVLKVDNFDDVLVHTNHRVPYAKKLNHVLSVFRNE